MRLITKITFLYLLITLVVFGIGGVITFNIFKNQIDAEQKRHLMEQFWILKKSIQEGSPIEALTNSKVDIKVLKNTRHKRGRSKSRYRYGKKFSDTLAWNRGLRRMEPHIKLEITHRINGKYYKFSIHDMMVEADDIYTGVSSSLIRMYIILLMVVVLLSTLIYFWLFQPFKDTLNKIKTFNLQKSKPLQFQKTNTKEFRKLNDFIRQMTSKVQKDYFTLKEFSENASHEMRTPLAIARGKLELLLESPDLKPDQIPLINSAYQSISKLEKLGESLALLTKIENEEFQNTEEINFTVLTEKTLFNFKELLELKNIELKKDLQDKVMVKINIHLADILMTNLLQNAIRHNVEKGEIECILNDSGFQIFNTGIPPKIPTEKLFERFKKSDQSSESIGLGLSIIKKICDVNNFKVHYDYVGDQHKISIIF